MKNIAPCRTCDKRHESCHASCVRYQEWKQKHQEELDAINKDKAFQQIYWNSPSMKVKRARHAF